MHLCECGHQPGDHYGDTGACEAADEALWGPAACSCPRYQWQGDD